MNTPSIDHFSRAHLRSISGFYYPRLKLALILYPTVSVTIGIIYLFLQRFDLGVLFGGILSLILAVMFYLFPLVFYRYRSPEIETMLPATTGEKLTMFAVACLIINPLLCYVPYYSVLTLLSPYFEHSELSSLVDTLSNEMIFSSYGLNILQSLPPLATCMFVVITSPKKRMGLAIGLTIVTVIALSFAAAIYGFVMALSEDSTIFHQAAQNNSATYEAGLAAGTAVASSWIKELIVVMGTLSLLYTSLMLWLGYCKMKRMQF